jgi:hypothetical protein
MYADQGTLKAWRLLSQKLGPRPRPGPAGVVKWLGGVQAQDYRWAKWSIGLRTDGCDDEEVERAIQEHQIVRTWMFRGTLHFVSASDLPWLTSLLAPGIIRGNSRRYRQLELDAAAFAGSQRVLQRALEAHGPLTRAEIKSQFEKAGVPAEGQQVPYLLQRAALDGLICHGPLRGSEPSYVLQSDWIDPQPALDRAEALRRLALRYFAGHGPATRQDFAWWAGLSAREARLVLDSAPEVLPVEGDGIQYYATGDPPPADLTDSAYLLPPFDAYLLAYKERSLALDPAYAKRVNPGGGMLKPTVLVNGEIRGFWSYKTQRRGMAISLQPFKDFPSRARDLIDTAASQLGSFMSIPIAVSFVENDRG